jgi:hypothetical protein
MTDLSNGPAPQVRRTNKFQAAHPGYAPESDTTPKDECCRARRHQGLGLRMQKGHSATPYLVRAIQVPQVAHRARQCQGQISQGNQYTCDLMHDASNAETYLKWFQTYLRVLGKKELRAPLDAATVEQRKLLKEFKKFSKAPKKEVAENKVTREVEVAATKVKLVEATAIHAIAIQACYDLFRKLLADDPRDQWDRIIREVHESDPWTLLDGHKNNRLRMKTSESFEDCITFHKRTAFSLDAAERQKSYMMGSLKKPHKMTIKGQVSHCEMMNGYISLLPMLQDSSLAVASTERGNVPLNNATLAGIVLATCHIDWRNLYKLNHKTVPESTRSMLHDLETIEKVFVEKNNEKAKSSAAKAGTVPQKGASVPRKKGKGGGSGGPA